MRVARHYAFVILLTAGFAAAAEFAVTLEGEPQLLWAENAPLYPAFAPDGKTLAVSLKRGNDYDVYRIDVATGKAELLVGGSGNQLYPAFFPEGNRLAYCSDVTGKSELYVYDLTKKTSVALTKNSRYNVRWPDVSPVLWRWNSVPVKPDYHNILYEADYGTYAEVFMAHEWGGEPVQLTATRHSLDAGSTASDGSAVGDITFEDIRAETFRYPRWDAGGFGYIAVMGPAALKVGFHWGFQIQERIPAPALRFYVPSGNYTQYLIMTGDGRITLYDAFRGTKYDVAQGDPTSPPAFSPDGKAVAFVRDGQLLLQRLTNPLSEVANLFELSDRVTAAQLETLAANGFFVSSYSFPNVVDAYYQYRAEKPPQGPFFITSDSVLYLVYLYYDYLLRTVETERLFPLIAELTEKALAASQTALAAVQPEFKDDVEFVRDYWLVARGLIDPAFADKARRQKVPARVVAEWENIADGAGNSDMFPGLDYTMFTVRGHYADSDELSRYFRTVMWLSQTTFPMNDPQRDAPSARRALALVAITTHAAANLMDDYYETIGIFVGEPESVNYRQLKGKANTVGADVGVAEVFNMVRKLPPPKIQPQRGFVFTLLPQVLTPDAYFLQRLVYPAVGTDVEPRRLPKGLDVFAALGDARAEEILLNVYHEDKYNDYVRALHATRAEADAYDAALRSKSFSYRWLKLLKTLTGKKDGRYPAFMRTTAWQDKSLITALASWTTLRHANVLYSKFSIAWGIGGCEEEPVPPKPKGFVEPNADFYRELLTLLEDTRTRLAKRGMWVQSPQKENGAEEDKAQQAFELLLKIVSRLEEISRKELAGTPLTESDYQFIEDYGSHLWTLASFYKVATGSEVPEEAEFIDDTRLWDPSWRDGYYAAGGIKRYNGAAGRQLDPAPPFQFIPVYYNEPFTNYTFAYDDVSSRGTTFSLCADEEGAPEEEYPATRFGGNITGHEQALVADVATYVDPLLGKTYVLHEALGRAYEIVCIHDVDGRPHLAHGSCFSYYEFVEEGRRLNDDDWKGRLIGESAYTHDDLKYRFKDVTDYEGWDDLEKQYKAILAKEFARSQTPQMPPWTASFFAPATFTVAVDALRLWNKSPVPTDFGVRDEGLAPLGTLKKDDRVTWLGLDAKGSSPNHPEDLFRWLLVETAGGKRGWVAHYGLVGKPVPTREVYLR